jgi:predicted porin
MKKSLLALAVLAFAGAASAQSSVTIFGKVDLALGKPIGTADKQVRDGAGSRLGFRGQEDLGGGMFAIFGIEHRFSPDTGADSSGGAAFWNGFSWVGIRAGFGQLTLGRHYTAAFTDIQNQIDPFGGDTVAGLRGVGMIPGSVGKVRVADSLRYDITAAGVKFAATVGEGTQPAATGVTTGPLDRPWSVAANYSAGPLFIGAGYEDPNDPDDHLWSVGARFGVGPATLRAGFSSGKNTANASVRGWLLGATVKAGPGDVLVGYARSRVAGVTTGSRWGVGYRYPLSKRTFLYADLAREGKVATEKSGYDLGIQHNF